VVAASLVAVEAMLVVLQGAAEIISVSGARAAMGVTTGIFFLVYGAGLGLCALALTKLQSWARAPVVVAQLIQLLVAWSFWGANTTYIALSMIAVAVLVLLGIFHPDSTHALADDPG